MSDMNKCRNCGVFVPIEKAFCPNCSEPIEPEEAPDRAITSSRDMMATLRDDPEHYKEVLHALKKESPPAPPATTEAQGPEPELARAVVVAAAAPPQPPQDFNYSAPHIAASSPASAKSNNRNLFVIIGIISLLILLFVFLKVFRIF